MINCLSSSFSSLLHVPLPHVHPLLSSSIPYHHLFNLYCVTLSFPSPFLPTLPLQKLKSTTGLFDLSFPHESLSFSSEYNSLHDPYLKNYFNTEAMKTKLIKSQFVTEDLYVKCSLKEYSEYRRFLENEFMKVCVCVAYTKKCFALIIGTIVKLNSTTTSYLLP